ncbi:MAG: hypothetical protein KAI50_02790 [Desulfobacterales bacterium]|nr:hypothetical protein [Desulfobacterales bacterium]
MYKKTEKIIILIIFSEAGKKNITVALTFNPETRMSTTTTEALISQTFSETAIF